MFARTPPPYHDPRWVGFQALRPRLLLRTFPYLAISCRCCIDTVLQPAVATSSQWQLRPSTVAFGCGNSWWLPEIRPDAGGDIFITVVTGPLSFTVAAYTMCCQCLACSSRRWYFPALVAPQRYHRSFGVLLVEACYFSWVRRRGAHWHRLPCSNRRGHDCLIWNSYEHIACRAVYLACSCLCPQERGP